MPTVSFVLPVYNEEQTLPELDRRLDEFLKELGESTEIIFVNDGSKDDSLRLLKEMVAKKPNYRLISLSRNFGHQAAITAGIDRADGDAVVVMDADLQDPPEVVKEMIARWREGYQVVYGVRIRREGETVFKRATAAVFYRLLRSLIGIDIPVDAGDFRLMSRDVVLALRGLREAHRFVRGMVAWVGFRQTAVHYERPARFAGETKYPFRKMVRFAIDGITSFSIVPMRMATYLGIAAGLLGVLAGAWAVYEKIYGGTVPGWTTLMMATSLGSSAQLLMIGVVGEYVGRIYEEVKRRPLYIVAESLNESKAAKSP